MQKDSNNVDLEVRWVCVMCFSNCLRIFTIAAEIEAIDLGHSSLPNYFSHSSMSFFFGFDFKSKNVLLFFLPLRQVLWHFSFVGLKSSGTLMKCV